MTVSPAYLASKYFDLYDQGIITRAELIQYLRDLSEAVATESKRP